MSSDPPTSALFRMPQPATSFIADHQRGTRLSRQSRKLRDFSPACTPPARRKKTPADCAEPPRGSGVLGACEQEDAMIFRLFPIYPRCSLFHVIEEIVLRNFADRGHRRLLSVCDWVRFVAADARSAPANAFCCCAICSLAVFRYVVCDCAWFMALP